MKPTKTVQADDRITPGDDSPSTGAMPGGPRKRDPQRTQQSILDAATAEFSEHGVGGARIERVAERAGLNKRLLYYYFGNKEDLYLAVLERTYADIRAAERALHLDELDPIEAI